MDAISPISKTSFINKNPQTISWNINKLVLGKFCDFVSYGSFGITVVAIYLNINIPILAILITALALKIIGSYCSLTNEKLAELAYSCLKNEDEESAIRLIKMGANVDYIIKDDPKTTILHFSVLSGSLNVINHLLKNGHSIERFPLKFACHQGTIQFLISMGADLKKADLLHLYFKDIIESTENEQAINITKNLLYLLKEMSFQEIHKTLCNIEEMREFLKENSLIILQKINGLESKDLLTKKEAKTLKDFISHPRMIARERLHD